MESVSELDQSLMIMATTILILSTGLFFYYLQTICEKVLRREFSQPFYQEVLKATGLDFPCVRQALSGSTHMDYSQMRLALKSDLLVLKCLAKNGNPKQRHFSWQEKVLLAYFQLLFHWLPIRHTFHIREKQSVMKLTAILHYLANLVGERVSSTDGVTIVVGHQS